MDGEIRNKLKWFPLWVPLGIVWLMQNDLYPAHLYNYNRRCPTYVHIISNVVQFHTVLLCILWPHLSFNSLSIYVCSHVWYILLFPAQDPCISMYFFFTCLWLAAFEGICQFKSLYILVHCDHSFTSTLCNNCSKHNQSLLLIYRLEQLY